MNRHLLHTILKQFQTNFLSCFTALTKCDLQTILAGESELLLVVLQERYGCTRTQAKAAWNEFVLRHVDGQPIEEGHSAMYGLSMGGRVGATTEP